MSSSPRSFRTFSELDEYLADRHTKAPAPSDAPTSERFYRHFVSFGPDQLHETARDYLSDSDLLRLAGRVNQVIALASKKKLAGEPREVTSYRVRIAEAKAKGSHAAYLKPIELKAEGGDPRVKLCVDLHTEGLKSSIIATRVGRSVEWVRKTIRAAGTTATPKPPARVPVKAF